MTQIYIVYRKQIDNKETKNLRYDKEIETKKQISKCKNCKYYICCKSKIKKKSFNIKHKKAKHSFYYELINEYSDCLILKKGEINENNSNCKRETNLYI